MSRTSIVIIALLIAAISGEIGIAQSIPSPNKKAVADRNYLVLIPDFTKATLKDNVTTIPFEVKNNYNEDVVISTTRNELDGLVTKDDSGEKIDIELFGRNNFSVMVGGPRPRQIVLEPGESKVFGCHYSMKTLGRVTNREIYGVISGWTARAKEKFVSYSAPFIIPPELRSQPWVDLGEKSDFVVTPDLTKCQLNGGSIVDPLVIRKSEYSGMRNNSWADSIQFPVIITNTTKQEYVAAVDSVRFYIVRDGSGRTAPFSWETIKTSDPVLKSGESAKSTGRCYIMLGYLESQGYKQGDKIVAAVGGRIPNTNQIFECYSAPFELPPLPASHPPK